VQRPLDDDRPLGRFCELHDSIRLRRLGGGKRQRAAEADEVMRVLGNVVLEARLAQRSGRELGVERHGADDLVGRGVAIPGFARKGKMCGRIHDGVSLGRFHEWKPFCWGNQPLST
jgi:hypothetical protein